MQLTGTKPAVALVTTGSCDASTYQLEVESEGDGVEVSFEVQASTPGETWKVSIEQNGTSILTGERQTDEDAEIDVDVTIRDAAQGDQFVATAIPSSGGKACTATLTN